MGLLDRLKVRASVPAVPPAPPVNVPYSWLQVPAFRHAGHFVNVVGESNYQPALEAASGGRTDKGARVPLVTAVLVREPQNRYDPNAVRVDVGGQTVGYLSRNEAPVFHSVLAGVSNMGRHATCRAWLTGGWWRPPSDSGSFGIKLDLHPELQVVDNCFVLPYGIGRVSITGEEHEQTYLAEVLDGADRAEVIASLEATDDGLVVDLGGRKVGRLTPKMGERYGPWVDMVRLAGLPEATCDARVVRGPKKIDVFLKLAKPWGVAGD